MGLFKKKSQKKTMPSSLEKHRKDIDVQIAVAKTKLTNLEDKTKARVRAEINNVNVSRKQKKEDPRAVVRLKNAYYCLLLIREARARMDDIEQSYQLNGILKDLSDVLKAVNSLEGKTDDVNTFFLRYRERKLKRNALAAKEGDMREFFTQSIDTLITDDTMEELLSKKRPLDDILNDDVSAVQEAEDIFGSFEESNNLDVDDILNVKLDE